MAAGLVETGQRGHPGPAGVRRAGARPVGEHRTGNETSGSRSIQTLPVGSPSLRWRTIRLVSAALSEMHDEWIALPRHYPRVSMGDIYHRLHFSSFTPPNAPKYRAS